MKAAKIPTILEAGLHGKKACTTLLKPVPSVCSSPWPLRVLQRLAALCLAVLSRCSQSVVFRRRSCDKLACSAPASTLLRKNSSDVEYSVLFIHTVRNVGMLNDIFSQNQTWKLCFHCETRELNREPFCWNSDGQKCCITADIFGCVTCMCTDNWSPEIQEEMSCKTHSGNSASSCNQLSFSLGGGGDDSLICQGPLCLSVKFTLMLSFCQRWRQRNPPKSPPNRQQNRINT